MADVFFRKIKRNPSVKEIVEYFDYLADTLSTCFENIDEENLTDELKNKIGG